MNVVEKATVITIRDAINSYAETTEDGKEEDAGKHTMLALVVETVFPTVKFCVGIVTA